MNANGNAIELNAFAANDAHIYRSRLVPSFQNLERKWKRGDYDSKLAVKLFEYTATDAAKAYVREYCGPAVRYHDVFDVADRRRAAEIMRDEFEAEIQAGNSWLNS